jgi:uncharacterized cupredoxin-like copper-binding protein
MNKHTQFLMMVVIAGLFLSACGPKRATIETVMSDFEFTPNTWEVPAGVEVTLKLKNEGTLEHEYVLLLLGQDATLPFDADDEPKVYWEHELAAGENVTVTFTAPAEPGTYNIVCGTPGHLEQGMRGTLVVK